MVPKPPRPKGCMMPGCRYRTSPKLWTRQEVKEEIYGHLDKYRRVAAAVGAARFAAITGVPVIAVPVVTWPCWAVWSAKDEEALITSRAARMARVERPGRVRAQERAEEVRGQEERAQLKVCSQEGRTVVLRKLLGMGHLQEVSQGVAKVAEVAEGAEVAKEDSQEDSKEVCQAWEDA
jgi:hypothetical protein